jgi:DNA-binding FadR family transcriptional regulator
MSERRLPAIQRPPLLADAAQEAVKAFINEHKLRPGDALPSQPELARQLGVSRNSVREAAKALQALGVVDTRPGSGLFVGQFSLGAIVENLPYAMMNDTRQLEEALDLRFYLELGVVDRIVAARTAEQMHQLDTTLQDWFESARVGGFNPDQDRAFHRQLTANVNSELIQEVLDLFWQVRNQARLHGTAAMPADPMRTYANHRAIAVALAQRSRSSLRKAIQVHYHEARAGL